MEPIKGLPCPLASSWVAGNWEGVGEGGTSVKLKGDQSIFLSLAPSLPDAYPHVP